jgi:hypothetical protein
MLFLSKTTLKFISSKNNIGVSYCPFLTNVCGEGFLRQLVVALFLNIIPTYKTRLRLKQEQIYNIVHTINNLCLLSMRSWFLILFVGVAIIWHNQK